MIVISLRKQNAANVKITISRFEKILDIF